MGKENFPVNGNGRDFDKRQAVCFHPEILYLGNKFYMVYTKKYVLLSVVIF